MGGMEFCYVQVLLLDTFAIEHFIQVSTLSGVTNQSHTSS
jgi:hypothetical protein